MDKRPVCPDCNEIMVKALEQDEEGYWAYRWLCGCKAKVIKGFCPNCERDGDSLVVAEREHEKDLDCLICDEKFQITSYAKDGVIPVTR